MIRHHRHVLANILIFVSTFVAAATNIADQRREDIAQFRTEFFAKDRAYASSARAEAERRLVELERTALVLPTPQRYRHHRLACFAMRSYRTTFTVAARFMQKAVGTYTLSRQRSVMARPSVPSSGPNM